MTVLLPCAIELLTQPHDGKPDQNLKNRPDQHGGMLVNADHLALVGQKVLTTLAGTASIFGASLIPAPRL